jgi:hypothetical protein
MSRTKLRLYKKRQCFIRCARAIFHDKLAVAFGLQIVSGSVNIGYEHAWPNALRLNAV